VGTASSLVSFGVLLLLWHFSLILSVLAFSALLLLRFNTLQQQAQHFLQVEHRSDHASQDSNVFVLRFIDLDDSIQERQRAALYTILTAKLGSGFPSRKQYIDMRAWGPSVRVATPFSTFIGFEDSLGQKLVIEKGASRFPMKGFLTAFQKSLHFPFHYLHRIE